MHQAYTKNKNEINKEVTVQLKDWQKTTKETVLLLF